MPLLYNIPKGQVVDPYYLKTQSKHFWLADRLKRIQLRPVSHNVRTPRLTPVSRQMTQLTLGQKVTRYAASLR